MPSPYRLPNADHPLYKMVVDEEEWYYPIKSCESIDIVFYKVGDLLHCPFGPAARDNVSKEELWVIKGVILSESEIDLAKSILADSSLAPLYINHKVLKYFTNFVLKGKQNESTK